MKRNHILTSLNLYRNSAFITPEELQTYDQFVAFINSSPECFERDNEGHVTGSAWVVSHDMTHVLLTHHKKLGIWIQLGGHADGSSHMPTVAMKEAQEESGIADLTFVMEGIYDIDMHLIPNKCSAHYDIRYIIQAPPAAVYKVSHESHDLAWVPLEKLSSYNNTPSLMRMAEKVSLITTKDPIHQTLKMDQL